MRFPLTLTWALALLLTAPLRAEPADSLITASDLLKINQPANPVISPDGKRVAYTVRSIETPASGDSVYRNGLWIASIDGDSAPRELTAGGSNAHTPAWHPSGDRIAYVRTEADGLARIWVLPLAGGEPYAVTPPLRGTAAPLWSSDGTHLLFTAVVAASEIKKPSPPSVEKNIPANDTPKPADKKNAPPPTPSPDGPLAARRAWLARNATRRDPAVIDRLNSPENPGSNHLSESTHLFAVDHAGAEPVDLTPGDDSYGNAAWLPDNKTIVCSGPSANPEPAGLVATHRLFSLQTDGSGLRPLTDTGDYSFNHPAVSPDGKQLACTARPSKTTDDLAYAQTRLALVDIDGGKFKILTEKLDRTVEAPGWSKDGKFIYFSAETNGGRILHRIAATGGNPERLTSSDMWVTGWSVGPEDLAMVTARPGNPGELYRTRLNGRSARILTAHNSDWLRDKKTTAPERRKLKQPDGTEIDYWVVKPPYLEGGFHYPLLVMVHGGPASMWGAANPALWHELQFFAARGYGIVFANPRGSSGYGYKFQHGSFQNWGPGPASDVLAAAGAVAKEPWVDADRQVILGGSYGAYLTAWIIATDSRFKAAVAARGVYDLTTFLGEGDAWPLVPWNFGGYPWQPDIRKLLDEQSPLTRVESIHTPLLIKQNDADHQTGSAQGELLYRALKILNRPVEFVRYPGATHDLSRSGDPDQRIDRLVRFDEFFQRFIGTPAQPIPPPPPPAPAPTPAAPPAPAKP